MFTPEKIKSDLLAIVEGVRNPPAILNFLPVLPYTRTKFDSLSGACIGLYREVAALPPNADTWEASQKLMDLEAEYRRLRAKLMIFPAVALIYVGFILLAGLLTLVDIPAFVKNVLKVDAPERLITFGIAGAFLYLATSVLTNLNQVGRVGDAVTRVADITVRVLLAIVVPIILVALFFTLGVSLRSRTVR